MAISRLEMMSDKRIAIVFEDGRKIAELTHLESFWRAK